jgi:DNA-binding MarR family transcriptional regulator
MLLHEDYRRLLTFRAELRRFLRWSDDRARSLGLTAAQHQLLLAIAGHDDRRGPTIGEVAEYLLLRHHSAVELVDRAEAAGVVRRTVDPDDHRLVRLVPTALGRRRLETLSAQHMRELRALGPVFNDLLRASREEATNR